MSILPDRPATPLGSARRTDPSTAGPDAPATDAVWLLDDAQTAHSAGALAIAERLCVGVRRVPLVWRAHGLLAAATRNGTLFGLASLLPLGAGLPVLTLSGGRRAARVAAWLAGNVGSRMVHVGAAGRADDIIDLHVVDTEGDPSGTMLPVLGSPHRLSPTGLATARAAWRERLGHLPHPRLALLLGGGPLGAELQPSEAFRIGRALGEAVSGAAGAVLAVAEPGAGREATDALAAGLEGCLHLLHRVGGPEPDAALGFLASADVVVVAGDAPAALLQACATTAPVYVMQAGGAVSPGQRRLQQRLVAAGQIRVLDGRIQAWRRPGLDEAGRVAQAVRAACLLPQDAG